MLGSGLAGISAELLARRKRREADDRARRARDRAEEKAECELRKQHRKLEAQLAVEEQRRQRAVKALQQRQARQADFAMDEEIYFRVDEVRAAAFRVAEQAATAAACVRKSR